MYLEEISQFWDTTDEPVLTSHKITSNCVRPHKKKMITCWNITVLAEKHAVQAPPQAKWCIGFESWEKEKYLAETLENAIMELEKAKCINSLPHQATTHKS